MPAPLSLITQILRNAIEKAFPNIATEDLSRSLDISQSTQPQFGHYQYNGAMKLAKLLSMPPRSIATAIVQHISNASLQKVDIAGPGFINFTLTPDYLSQQTLDVLLQPNLNITPTKDPQRIIIDFSSPNTAKEMHVGHLRSTIIGDSLSRIFEFLGHDVLRLNHIGDWGTAFGMLIAYLKRHAPDVLDGTADADLTALVSWYRAAKLQFDSDPEFKTESQLAVVALQGGDPGAKKAWELICAISRKAYQQIYDLLDVKINERGESYYNDMLPTIVADLQQKGLVEISEGAKCIFLEGFKTREETPLPLIIQKSDGGYNYASTDMATIHHRITVEKGSRLIYITDAGQATHFAMIFKAAELAGYLDPKRVTVEHVPFGLVLGENGKKFSTRSGNTERLADLLDQAVSHASELLNAKNPSMTTEEREHTAKLLGIGAVKYADLSCNRTGNYVFSYDRMLRFDGNTAAFLMYAYVRAAGIKRRLNIDPSELLQNAKITLKHESELFLALQILQLDETLTAVTRDLLPNRLCDYLYALAEKFNAFFRDCRVEGTPEQTSRLLLCEAFARTMQLGLSLLGIRTVEKM